MPLPLSPLSSPLRVLAYNILDGGTGRADPLIEVIAASNPDLVVLVEATDPDVLTRAARRLGMDLVQGPSHDDGVAVLTRGVVVATINHALLSPSSSRPPRALLEVRLRLGPTPWTLFALHLTAKATLHAEQLRLAELQAVLDLARPLRDAGTPHLLAGDFNANSPRQHIRPDLCTPATRQAALAQGGIIPRDAISRLEAAGYIDTLAAANPALAQTAGTFSTQHPGQRVDYIFAFAARVRSAWIETDRLATYASDHYPVGAELSVPQPSPAGAASPHAEGR